MLIESSNVETTSASVSEKSADQPTETKDPQQVKTFTRDEVNKMIAAEKSKAIEAARLEAQKKQEEIEKLSKMKADERAAHEMNQIKAAAEQAKIELNAYRLKDKAVAIASEKGIDTSLLNLINFKTETDETTESKVEIIATTFNAAVQAEVEKRLKQTSPTTVRQEGVFPKGIPKTIF